MLAGLGEEDAGTRQALRRLPVETSTFVGREHELGELAALLAHTRLLTLAGAGGVGKTRLALELARERADSYDAGVVLVELDALVDGALVPEPLRRPSTCGRCGAERRQSSTRCSASSSRSSSCSSSTTAST